MSSGLTYKRQTTSSASTKQMASVLAQYLRPGDVIVLNGNLGAGKTQFAQGLAAGLGIEAPVTSPTFNILLEYDGGRLPLYHFDLYRLEDEEQLEDIGYYETIEADGVSLIEWGDKFPHALPYGYLEITIQITEGTGRLITARACGERARALLFVWAQNPQARLMKTRN